jgi:hypothetical protein
VRSLMCGSMFEQSEQIKPPHNVNNGKRETSARFVFVEQREHYLFPALRQTKTRQIKSRIK